MKSTVWMVRGLTAALISSVLIGTPQFARSQGVAPILSEAAAVAAEKIQERLRAAMINVTPEDMKAIEVTEQHRLDVKNIYVDLSHYQAAYQKDGNQARLQEIAHEKEELRLIQRNLPAEFSNSPFLPRYMESIRSYLKDSTKSQEWIKRTKGQEKIYRMDHPEVPLAGEKAATKGGETGKTGGTSGSGSGGKTGGSGGGSVNGQPDKNLEVYIIHKTGDCEFYINDQKVENERQGFALNGQSTFTVRVLAIGARRKQSREFIANVPDHTTALEHDDYGLGYETRSGTFTGSTHWKVDQESYVWSGTHISNSSAQSTTTSSGKNKAVKDDTLEFRYQGAFTFKASVQGTVKWKGRSQRPAGVRDITSDDSASGSIEFSVSPK